MSWGGGWARGIATVTHGAAIDGGQGGYGRWLGHVLVVRDVVLVDAGSAADTGRAGESGRGSGLGCGG